MNIKNMDFNTFEKVRELFKDGIISKAETREILGLTRNTK